MCRERSLLWTEVGWGDNIRHTVVALKGCEILVGRVIVESLRGGSKMKLA